MTLKLVDSEYRRFVWQYALEYLERKADISLVRKLMSSPFRDKPNDMKDLYVRLLESLVNRQGMPNSIGNIGRLSSTMSGFEPEAVFKKFGNNWEDLFDEIKQNVNPESKMNKRNPHNYWVVFCKGSLSGAQFLVGFEDCDSFISFVQEYDEIPVTRVELPMLLGDEIFGFGFPLACDYLKELGFLNLSKPDVHLRDIFTGIGLSNRTDLGIFRAVSTMAEEVGETPYAVDKAFWLIGSGNLYNANIRFDTDKYDFIREVNELSGRLTL